MVNFTPAGMPQPKVVDNATPPLENGARLTRQEFELLLL